MSYAAQSEDLFWQLIPYWTVVTVRYGIEVILLVNHSSVSHYHLSLSIVHHPPNLSYPSLHGPPISTVTLALDGFSATALFSLTESVLLRY